MKCLLLKTILVRCVSTKKKGLHAIFLKQKKNWKIIIILTDLSVKEEETNTTK